MTYPRKYQQCDTRDGSRYRVEEAAAIIKRSLRKQTSNDFERYFAVNLRNAYSKITY